EPTAFSCASSATQACRYRGPLSAVSAPRYATRHCGLAESQVSMARAWRSPGLPAAPASPAPDYASLNPGYNLPSNRRQNMPKNPGSKAAAGRGRLSFVRRAVPLLVAGLHTGVLVSVALAQNEDRVKAGLAAWRNSGCADCHGAFADGEKQRDEMPTGANL